MITEPTVPASVLERIRAPFLEHGAEPVEPPVLQPLNDLLDLVGETMRARLFVVQGEGEELCLRPDFTVPVVRAHVAGERPAGAYRYEGRAFRVAAPGRAQEFLQIGLEQIGAGSGPQDDADVIAIAWRAATAGGRNDLSLSMGDIGLFDAFAAALEIPAMLTARLRRSLSSPDALQDAFERSLAPETRQTSPLTALLAGRPEAEGVAMLGELWTMMGVQPVSGRSPLEVVRRLNARASEAATPAFTTANAELIRRYLAISDVPERALDGVRSLAREAGVSLDQPLESWAMRLSSLREAGVRTEQARLTTAFGRVFSYYDGVLFEVRSAALDADQAVAGGGRYDRLPQALGGVVAGAVGCTVRPARAWNGKP